MSFRGASCAAFHFPTAKDLTFFFSATSPSPLCREHSVSGEQAGVPKALCRSLIDRRPCLPRRPAQSKGSFALMRVGRAGGITGSASLSSPTSRPPALIRGRAAEEVGREEARKCAAVSQEARGRAEGEATPPLVHTLDPPRPRAASSPTIKRHARPLRRIWGTLRNFFSLCL